MKHTPGPWRIDEKRQDTWIIYGWPNRDEIEYVTEYPICELGYIGGDAEANAHLIAAAPDLLEACKRVLEFHPCTCTRSWPRAGNHESTCNQNILGQAISRAERKE